MGWDLIAPKKLTHANAMKLLFPSPTEGGGKHRSWGQPETGLIFLASGCLAFRHVVTSVRRFGRPIGRYLCLAVDWPRWARRDSDEEEHMKKIAFLTLLITATLLLTLAFPVAATGPKSPAAPMAVPAIPAAAAATQEHGERGPHPRVHEAIEAMRNARDLLQRAEGDFHGHRNKAIEHLDQAIHEAADLRARAIAFGSRKQGPRRTGLRPTNGVPGDGR